jgi:hypothetical protein
VIPTGQVPRAEWSAGSEVSKFQGQLEVYLAKFQDPAQSDSMSRLQNDLDETKIILVSTVLLFIYYSAPTPARLLSFRILPIL